MLYGLNDISIIPAVVSDIDSRSECIPYTDGRIMGYPKYLPLFAAPMSCVINDKNWEDFRLHGIRTVIPRNISLPIRLVLSAETFSALSLDEFELWFVKEPNKLNKKIKPYHICVDIANGHMSKLIRLCSKAKEIHGKNLILMTGNIANPETYLEYAKAGIDFVRIGIGSGNVCTTSANGGIHYPMASLIKECAEQRELCIQSKTHPNNCDAIKSIPKIVADGGFKNFDHIIKALALGADYCMLGEIFAKTVEACGKMSIYPYTITGLHFEKGEWHWKEQGSPRNSTEFPYPKRDYYGMSTKRAQKEMGVTDPEKLKTAEGIVKQVTIDYTLNAWVENFIHYLKSAMSYTGSTTLMEFQKVRTELISSQAFNAFYK